MANSYPDPLEISPVNPLDYRCENGKWIHDPGWWKDIPALQEKQELSGKGKSAKSKTNRTPGKGRYLR